MLGTSSLSNIAAVFTAGDQNSSSIVPSVFSYSNLVHAVSGAVGSVVAITVFYPLDTVRTRLQIDDNRKAKHTHQICADIVKEEGITGLYLGWFPVVTALCCSNFVYFYTYSSLKAKLIQGKKSSPLTDLSLAFISGIYRGWQSLAFTMWISNFVYFYTYHILQSSLLTLGPTPGPITDLLLAFLAGVVNVLTTTPLWVANTRLKLQGAKLYTKAYEQAERKYDGILDCLVKIAQQEGFWSLWNGTAPSILLAANPAIHFMVYESLKRYFQRMFNTSELSGLLYFVIGAIAKSVATSSTYPLQVVQSRLRAGFSKAEKAQSMIQNLLYLVKQQGLGALYKGMEAKLLQTVLTAALMFLAYEKIAAFTFKLMGMHSAVVKA